MSISPFYRPLSLCLLLCSLTASLPAPASAAPAEGIPAARWALLQRGVNVPEWFRSDVSLPEIRDEIALIKSLGFRHARVMIPTSFLLDEAHPSVPNADTLDRLDAVVQLASAQNLGVIVCPANVDRRLWTDPLYAAAFGQSWGALAKHLSATDPAYVFLEVVNEPTADSSSSWNAILPGLLQAMRKAAPAHTLIADANQRDGLGAWDPIHSLITMPVSDDPNTAYNFHYYPPTTFTFQGVTWSWEFYPFFKKIPYPSSPQAVAPIVAQMPNATKFDRIARAYVTQYGQEGWNGEKIRAELKPVAAWAKAHNLRVTCNEYGVYRPSAPTEDRITYLNDIRSGMEAEGIGWSLFEMEGGFGIYDLSEVKPTLDVKTVTALGLLPAPGDVNNDQVVNVEDAVMTLRQFVGLVAFNSVQARTADMNGDGVLNIEDAVQILKIAVGLTP